MTQSLTHRSGPLVIDFVPLVAVTLPLFVTLPVYIYTTSVFMRLIFKCLFCCAFLHLITHICDNPRSTCVPIVTMTTRLLTAQCASLLQRTQWMWCMDTLLNQQMLIHATIDTIQCPSYNWPVARLLSIYVRNLHLAAICVRRMTRRPVQTLDSRLQRGMTYQTDAERLPNWQCQ